MKKKTISSMIKPRLLIVYCSLFILVKKLDIAIRSFPYPKYFSVAATSWQNGFVYRFNFLMWRVRMLISLLTFYYLWAAVSGSTSQIHTYSSASIITYVIVEWLIWNIVVSSRSIDAQGEIASGDLNNYLIKPVNYFVYWFSRDLSDKLLNILFSIFELFIFFLIIKPNFVMPQHLITFPVLILSILLSVLMYFVFSFIISMTTFWFYQNNGWAQRFLIFTLITSLGGGLFPLDMLPQSLANILKYLPTAYFSFFPTQIFLERVNLFEISLGLIIQIIWIISLAYLAKNLWIRGLRVYGAYGR